MTLPGPRSERRAGRALLVASGVTLAGVLAIGMSSRSPTPSSHARSSPVEEPAERTEAPSPRPAMDTPSPAEADARRPSGEPVADVTAAPSVAAPSVGATPVRPRVLELEPAGPFATRDAERSFWQERLVGERLTLDGRAQSFGALKRALDQGTLSDGERTELERRRTALEVKLGEQTQRVALIERRIDELAAP